VPRKSVKVLVWDLDNTLWDGVLLEGDAVQPRPAVVDALRELDARGILLSIASKNDHDTAMSRLRDFGLADYFIYPQIGWSAKSAGIAAIAKSINVGLDTICFIDDDPFERDEVLHALPEVMVCDAAEAPELCARAELMPRFITDESALRRRMYQADIERNLAEQDFQGPQEEFLAGLGMRFSIHPAREADLRRAEELTVRTNQLNSSGQTFSYEELDELRRSPDHLLLVAGLEDRYGTYGKIGLALIAKEPAAAAGHPVQSGGGPPVWTLKLMLMSCRVISRGVGSILLGHILQLAKAAGARLLAEFKSTPRNRMMLVAYKFAGFEEIGRRGELLVFEHSLAGLKDFPPYVEVALGEHAAQPAALAAPAG
jgi:FkbH-like protein